MAPRQVDENSPAISDPGLRAQSAARRGGRRRRDVGVAGMIERELQVTAVPRTVRVPQHVVYRDFAAETVVLNLNTGLYHGLNPTAGRMLKVLDELGDVSATASRCSNEYRRPREEIAADLETLCRDLLARGLIEPAPPSA